MNTTTNYKELLEKDGTLVQFPIGYSMLPMLRQKRDTVVIKRINRKPKENDVVLYLRDDGKYVLHRIIKVKNDGYVIRGDNCYYHEYDITDKHIIGILEGFYRDETYVDCSSNKRYKVYVFFRRYNYYPRRLLHSLRGLLSKIKHTLIK